MRQLAKMNKNVLDQAIDYLEYSKNLSGEYLFFETKPISAQLAADIPQLLTNQEVPTLPIKKEEIAETKTTAPPTVPHPSSLHYEESVDPTWKDSQTLPELKQKIQNCVRCPLGATRTKFVFGEGNPNADIMVIGEAPGADEDAQGMPFVGRAGQLLTKILESVGFSREDVFIGNINKYRPPANRRPTNEEVAACEPYLIKQIEIIKPKFILALGLTAADTLFKKSHKMGDIRGKLFSYNGIQTMVTYHPAALLRNPAWKKPVWEDVQLLRKLYDDYLSNNK